MQIGAPWEVFCQGPAASPEIIKKDILMEKLQKTEIELKRKQKNIPVMYRKKRIEKKN